MKVVLFCGGLGTRLREHSETIPKPLVNIGYRPMLWHLMRYYAHYGHKDFILCLGYRGDMIREYFLKYNEAMTNDFSLSQGGRKVELHEQRPGRLADHLRRHRFAQQYRPAPDARAQVSSRTKRCSWRTIRTAFRICRSMSCSRISTARRWSLAFASVNSAQTFHTVQAGDDGMVTGMSALNDSGIWINGGYFVLRGEIFDYMKEGEELVESPSSA